ncbi:hypothetical protein RD792_003649 [Penstemon davidsonii]|uniref:Leucine-rich repeat-containing N-terminal plant-type domain-containing protein n=1 Tax=Penstemon davidsonii TaxID=160366 RepID=A0ABR0DG71_9LAMI|nr:hypothetical protein RD792_003649 [Penstemon davidsonii]
MGKMMMSSTIILSIFLFIDLSVICCSEKVVKPTFVCITRERKALLKFRESFWNPFPTLSSWNDTKDCCTWQGIGCDKFTGHVTRLDLGYKSLLHSDNSLQGKMIDPSHSELKHLSYLDLSGINFQLSPIPAFLGSMTQLRHLNLSRTSLSGVVPHDLGNLSSLSVLDLGGYYQLEFDDLMWVSRLSSLEHLNMSYVDVLQRICSSALRTLYLFGNQLSCPFPSWLGNLRDLRELSLGGDNSQLSGRIPLSLGQLSNLEILHLSSSSLDGTLCEAHFAKISKLRILAIDSLKFIVGFDWVPHFQLEDLEMQSCDIESHFPLQKELVRLYLMNCSISGALPNWFHYMNLTELQLSQNHIQGPIPNNISRMLPNLEVLLLDENYITGSLPDSLCKLKFLIALDLSKNQLSCNVLDCWGNFQQL